MLIINANPRKVDRLDAYGGAHRHQLCPKAMGARRLWPDPELGEGYEDRALYLQRTFGDRRGETFVSGCVEAWAAVHHPGRGAV